MKILWFVIFERCQAERSIIYLPLAFELLGRQALANSVDIDQTPQNAASNQGLHYLQLIH